MRIFTPQIVNSVTESVVKVDKGRKVDLFQKVESTATCLRVLETQNQL